METYSHNGRDYPPYVCPSNEEILRRFKLIEKYLIEACQSLGLNLHDYDVDFHLIRKVILRTDQRKLHYLMYHNNMRMNELKYGAVMVFWILRFKPIQRPTGGRININELIARELILRVVKNFRHLSNIPRKEFTDRVKHELLYFITNRDISYDNMTMLVESLAA